MDPYSIVDEPFNQLPEFMFLECICLQQSGAGPLNNKHENSFIRTIRLILPSIVVAVTFAIKRFHNSCSCALVETHFLHQILRVLGLVITYY